MNTKLMVFTALLSVLSACMSTAPQLGPDASAWGDYLSWYKANSEPMTGDPTGFLSNVHDGINAYRNVYVNPIGEAVNKGEQALPYPEGTILAKESFNNLDALNARRSPDMTLMIKLAAGSSPETGDWEYVLGANGNRRGSGDSGLGAFCRDCHLFGAANDYTFINSKFFETHR